GFRRPAHVNDNSDVMLLYFTSGTSGEPKMVAHDFTYPLGHIVTARFWHNLRPGDIHLTLADTGWGKAVWGKLYGQWICGADVFVYDFDKFVPKDLLAIMEKYRINSFCAPPTVFRFLIREDVKSFDLSALDRCTIAGEALNPSVFEKWKELTGISMREGFGQTETTLTVGTFPWVEPRPGSMGLPNPLYGIDIVDEDGNSVDDNVNGEIVIRADRDGHKPAGLFKEYLDDEELTDNAWHDGLYHTGDIAWRDKDGYLWFVSRKDDVIKSSGYRIGPFEVESACLTHPAVVECAITAVPDDVRGQIVKATIVLAADYVQQAGADLVKDIQNHVKRITAPYKYPRVIEFVKELPKTISGKIRRVAIRATDAANSAIKIPQTPPNKGIIHA
ncbi:MAG: AMP-binding protein, partial [Muribaculaceae bacterium]|nr:AMP-binding protein [Muribaculaceae bacterium]